MTLSAWRCSSLCIRNAQRVVASSQLRPQRRKATSSPKLFLVHACSSHALAIRVRMSLRLHVALVAVIASLLARRVLLMRSILGEKVRKICVPNWFGLVRIPPFLGSIHHRDIQLPLLVKVPSCVLRCNVLEATINVSAISAPRVPVLQAREANQTSRRYRG